jgi:hypothetical protein
MTKHLVRPNSAQLAESAARQSEGINTSTTAYFAIQQAIPDVQGSLQVDH